MKKSIKKQLKHYDQDVILTYYEKESNEIYSFYFKDDKQLYHYVLGSNSFFCKIKTIPNIILLKNMQELDSIINIILNNNNHFFVTSTLRFLARDYPDEFTLLSAYEEETLQGVYQVSFFNDFYQNCAKPQDFIKYNFGGRGLFINQHTLPKNIVINTDKLSYDYKTEKIFSFQDNDLQPFDLTLQQKTSLSTKLTQLFPSVIFGTTYFPKRFAYLLIDFNLNSNSTEEEGFPSSLSIEEIQQKDIGELTESEFRSLQSHLLRQYTDDFLSSQSFKELQQQVLEKINQTSFTPLQKICYDKAQNVLYYTWNDYCEYDNAVLFFMRASTDYEVSKCLHTLMNPVFLNKQVYIWNHNSNGFSLLKVVQRYPINSLWNSNLAAKPIEVYCKDNDQEEIIQILPTKKETMATYGLTSYMLNKLISQQTPNADGLYFRVKVFQQEQLI